MKKQKQTIKIFDLLKDKKQIIDKNTLNQIKGGFIGIDDARAL